MPDNENKDTELEKREEEQEIEKGEEQEKEKGEEKEKEEEKDKGISIEEILKREDVIAEINKRIEAGIKEVETEISNVKGERDKLVRELEYNKILSKNGIGKKLTEKIGKYIDLNSYEVKEGKIDVKALEDKVLDIVSDMGGNIKLPNFEDKQKQDRKLTLEEELIEENKRIIAELNK